MSLLSRPDITRMLADHGLAPRRDLGQNFVADPNTVRRIARLASVGPGAHVLEIGAGLGSLTLALAETGAEVVAVEVDRGVVPVLRAVVAGLGNVRVVESDAMRTDWAELLGSHHWVVVANLPYNVGTPLVCDLLDFVPQIDRFLVMVQREVAERFCAAPRTAAYGAVSVKVAYWAMARIAGTVPASVFVPRPNVESALAEIVRRPVPATDADPSIMFGLVKTAFGQRRKMLRRSLAQSVPMAVFDAAGIDPQRRPEELDVEEWGRLANALADHQRATLTNDPDPSPTPDGTTAQ